MNTFAKPMPEPTTQQFTTHPTAIATSTTKGQHLRYALFVLFLCFRYFVFLNNPVAFNLGAPTKTHASKLFIEQCQRTTSTLIFHWQYIAQMLAAVMKHRRHRLSTVVGVGVSKICGINNCRMKLRFEHNRAVRGITTGCHT
jgi:hypothetical protein